MTPLEGQGENSSAEFKLLLRCASPWVDVQEKMQIRRLSEERVEWPILLRKALGHGLLPLLSWHLQSIHPPLIPQTVLEELHRDFRANAKRNLLLILEMTRLHDLLQTNGIPVMFFKGPLLAMMAYGNPSLRPSADLDILIHPSDFLKLRSLLSGEGYLFPTSLSRLREEMLFRCASECHFLRAENGIELDVHWRILPRAISSAFNGDEIWERVQYFSLGGTQVPTLSREDLLLFLCIHGSKHLWERLSWISDIADLIGASHALDWAEILKRAEIRGFSRMLFLGLTLAHELIAVELPAEVSLKMGADAKVEVLAAQVRGWLATDRASKLTRRVRVAFHLRVTQHFADKIRYLSRWALSPTAAEFLLLNLPRALYFLYYVVRPFRLLAKCGLRAANLLAAASRSMRGFEWL